EGRRVLRAIHAALSVAEAARDEGAVVGALAAGCKVRPEVYAAGTRGGDDHLPSPLHGVDQRRDASFDPCQRVVIEAGEDVRKRLLQAACPVEHVTPGGGEGERLLSTVIGVGTPLDEPAGLQ